MTKIKLLTLIKFNFKAGAIHRKHAFLGKLFVHFDKNHSAAFK